MTICIAAICADRKEILITSDRMVTLSIPSTEFEHDTSKFIKLTERCYMGTAGDATIHTDIIRRVKNEIKINSEMSIYDIAESIKKAYIQERSKRINDKHFLPRQMDMKDFYSSMEKYPAEFIEKMDNMVEEYDMEVEVLIAGVDNEGGHIFKISEPGEVACFDDLGYASIGSGESHSEWVFIYNEYNPNISKRNALLTLYKAKKRAETAEGVGEKTDLVTIDIKTSHVHEPGSSLLKQLYKIYSSSERKTGINIKEKKMLEKLEF